MTSDAMGFSVSWIQGPRSTPCTALGRFWSPTDDVMSIVGQLF